MRQALHVTTPAQRAERLAHYRELADALHRERMGDLAYLRTVIRRQNAARMTIRAVGLGALLTTLAGVALIAAALL